MEKALVTINPFAKRISVKSEELDTEIIMCYDEVDEWQGFQMGQQDYDLHLLYEASVGSDEDNHLDVSIYPVTYKEGSRFGEPDYTKAVPVELKVKW